MHQFEAYPTFAFAVHQRTELNHPSPLATSPFKQPFAFVQPQNLPQACRPTIMNAVTLFVFIVLLFSLSRLLQSCLSRAKYPPGPRGLPFLGVARQRPTAQAWRTYAQWGQDYGNEGIMSFQILGRRIVVINSREVAEDLLVHRGAVYSDRPFPAMSGHLMQREKSIFLMPYNERFKAYRRLMHQGFNPRAAQAYWPLQERATTDFLRDLLHSPDRLYDNIRRNAGAVILKISYGYNVQNENDHFVATAEESMRIASLAGTPGKWLVDSFPILRFVPSWFPGAGFKRKAKAWGHHMYIQSLEPHDYVKEEMAAGRAIPSFTSRLLYPDGACVDAEREDIVLWTAGALYAGGSDTTVSAVHSFFYAMACHPEIQRRAQAELDTVIGRDRLPTLADRSALPYVDCLIKEVLRWHPAVPLALPHTTQAQDTYRGYTIPRGCFVIVNLWAMLHDPMTYPCPMEFDPTRFEGPNPQPDPRELVFGRGRRVCPGQHIGEASLFIQVACVLTVFDVHRPLDMWGREVDPALEFSSKIVSQVLPFKCRITPRSAHALALVDQALASDDS